MTMEELTVYGAIGAPGTERTLAWELLALALERELGLPQMPEIAREPGETLLPGLSGPLLQHQPQPGRGGLRSGPAAGGSGRGAAAPGPRRLAGDLEDEAFFRLWTAREATVKRRGLGIGALVGGGPEPDPLCRPLEGFLPGYVVTVCPSREARVRTVFIENIAGR